MIMSWRNTVMRISASRQVVAKTTTCFLLSLSVLEYIFTIFIKNSLV